MKIYGGECLIYPVYFYCPLNVTLVKGNPCFIALSLRSLPCYTARRLSLNKPAGIYIRLDKNPTGCNTPVKKF